MKKLLPLLILILTLAVPTAVLAHDKENEGRGRDFSKFELKIDHEDNGEDEAEHEFELENETNEFEIRGEITAVSNGSFVINGKTIKIDLSVTGKFEQKGDLVEGAFAKVEGIVVNGALFAEEIKIKAQGKIAVPPARFKAKIEIHPPINPTATDSATVSATPSAKVEIKARGPLDQVIAFVESILDFLKTIL